MALVNVDAACRVMRQIAMDRLTSPGTKLGGIGFPTEVILQRIVNRLKAECM